MTCFIGGSSERGSHRLSDTACPVLWITSNGRSVKFGSQIERVEQSTEPQLFGTLMHLKLAQFNIERLQGEPVDIGPTFKRIVRRQDPTIWSRDKIKKVRDRVTDCFEAWRLRWSGAYAEPKSVEVELRATLADLGLASKGSQLGSEIVTSRHDLIGGVVGSDGVERTFVIDYKGETAKVSKRTGETYFGSLSKHYEISMQVILNLMLARLHFEKIDGFLVERFSRNAPYVFDRDTVHVEPETYQAMGREIVSAVMADSALVRLTEGATPDTIGDSIGKAGFRNGRCFDRYGACPNLEACKTRSTRSIVKEALGD